MVKLLLCLVCGLAVGAITLQLRQQRMELGHQSSELNDKILAQQARLWSQQLQIAVYTAPNSIQQTVKAHDLKMVSQSPVRAKNANWIDATAHPDAE